METATPETRAYRPLRADMPAVTLVPEGCLSVRTPLSECTACIDHCPPRALTLQREGPSLADGCLRCGRCAAACPTGALRVSGFPHLSTAETVSSAGPANALAVDCWRVPREHSPEGALRVPCLGGLDGGTLALLHKRYPAGVVLLDRGWCTNCPAGGCRRPQDKALASAGTALAAAGSVPHNILHTVSSPLAATLARPEIPEAMAERAVSRRGLFRHLAGRAAAAAEQWQEAGEETPAPGGFAKPLQPLPRRRLIAALPIGGGRLPTELSPALHIEAQRCANHRICAALCPTGALQPVDDATGTGLDFDPAPCIGCALCQRVCPENALTVTPAGGDGAVIPLTRFTSAPCRRCGHEFTAASGQELCPGCRKDQALLTGDGHRLLFGHPPEAEGSGEDAVPAVTGSKPAFHANKSRGKEAFHDRRL